MIVEDVAAWDDLTIGNAKCHDRDSLALFYQVSRSAIDDDISGARLSGLCVGFQAPSGSHGRHEHSFTFPKSGGLHKIPGNFNASLVVDVGLFDDCPVEFGLQLNALHLVTKGRSAFQVK